ncbi:MAG: OadG family protein [Desulfobacterales bacterium]|nr:OadG family protein [Desulfobacterales bacterium]
MTGLEAIQHYNGFAMAGVGITIVFTALVALSLIISQLHKVLLAWENRAAWADAMRRWKRGNGRGTTEKELPDIEAIREPARQFHLLIEFTGEPFSLPVLIKRAESRGLARVHFTVSRLIECHLIVPDEDGYFRWNHEVYNRFSGRRKK